MMVYRISKRKYATDLSGTGAETYGGRWNSKGTKMVYTSSSIALAMTEVAVQVPFGILPVDYIVISIDVPDTHFSLITPEDLRGTHWNSHPPSHITQKIGDRFVADNKDLMLQVLSAVVPGDFNFLINPAHQAFSKVKVMAVHPFSFDARSFNRE